MEPALTRLACVQAGLEQHQRLQLGGGRGGALSGEALQQQGWDDPVVGLDQVRTPRVAAVAGHWCPSLVATYSPPPSSDDKSFEVRNTAPQAAARPAAPAP